MSIRISFLIVVLLFTATAHAQIYRWDNGQVIPGTEGITPVPGVRLDRRQLEYANLFGANLTNSRFEFSNLNNANLNFATLTNANLDGATVTGTNFNNINGFAKEQLYSTGSYLANNLQGIQLSGNDLSGWDFSGQFLTNADLSYSKLSGVDFTNSVIAKSNFSLLEKAEGGLTVDDVLTPAQLYTTKSYQDHRLHGIVIDGINFSGADLSHQDLKDALLIGTILKNSNFTGSNAAHASFRGADLHGASLANTDLRGAVFLNANLSQANLVGAVIDHADFSGITSISKGQLYSTSSYTNRDLAGINLSNNDLGGWDFGGQNLAFANLWSSNLKSTDFASADLRGAIAAFEDSTILRNTIQSSGEVNGLSLGELDFLVVRNLNDFGITILKYLTATNESSLQFHLSSDPWDSLISFQPGIPVQLGGTLELTFTVDTQLSTQSGRTIKVFDWTGVSPTGQFQVASPYTWDLTNLYKTGEVTFLSHILGDCTGNGMLTASDLSCVATLDVRDAVLDALRTLPGDLDGNKQVDFADFLVLSGNFDHEIGKYSEGNVDLVGGVAFADFLILADNFGKSPEVRTVPEPSCVGLAFVAIAGLTICYRRRKLN